ncbi:unnamed protein product [Lupinus luteus]|uniref:Uncharacterized protein n=1 Tax=Lupinus luteus TaxID=3873 RepID=A0AAV1WJ16_LUPLU
MNRKGFGLKSQARSSAKQEQTKISATRAIDNHQTMSTSTRAIDNNQTMSTSTSNIQNKNQDQRVNPFQKRHFTTIIGSQAKGAMDEQIYKKKKITKKCPSMSLDDFLNHNKEREDGHEGEDEQEEGVQECEDREENEEVYEVGEYINHQNEQGDETAKTTVIHFQNG